LRINPLRPARPRGHQQTSRHQRSAGRPGHGIAASIQPQQTTRASTPVAQMITLTTLAFAA
jgi:hypothetical protein